MSEPTTVNKAASIVNQILKALISGAGSEAIKAAIIAEQPWLGLPIIKQIFGWIVDRVASSIYTQAADAATKVIIDLQINVEESSVNASFQNLQMAVASGDAQTIQKASADLSDAYASLIHYDGSASP